MLCKSFSKGDFVHILTITIVESNIMVVDRGDMTSSQQRRDIVVTGSLRAHSSMALKVFGGRWSKVRLISCKTTLAKSRSETILPV